METKEIDLDGRFTVAGHSGVAWYVFDYATTNEPIMGLDLDEDGEEYEYETGEYEPVEDRTRVVCAMVGDNRRFTFDVEDLTPIADEDYCGGCGQVGCGWG